MFEWGEGKVNMEEWSAKITHVVESVCDVMLNKYNGLLNKRKKFSRSHFLPFVRVMQGKKLTMFNTHCQFPNNGVYQLILLDKLHNVVQ